MEQLQHNTTNVPVYATYEGRKSIRTTYKFKSLGKTWDASGLNTIKNIGPLMKLMKEHNPLTFDEWKHVYLAYGRSWEQMLAISDTWANISSLPRDEAIAHVVIHVIDETWEGAHGEHLAIDLLREQLPQYDYELADDSVDTEYSIDIIVYEKGTRLVCGGIQVKPGSYFSRRFRPVEADGGSSKERYHQNNIRFMEEMGAIVYYMSVQDVKKGFLRLIPLEEVYESTDLS